jgi:hypothetical protein
MDRRKNLLWLAGGILIGSLGLILVASLTTGGGKIGSAQAAQTHRPGVMSVLAARRMQAVQQEPKGGGSQKPNILFIMGDDIGWMQPSIYHRGLMVGETPNIDRIGREGAILSNRPSVRIKRPPRAWVVRLEPRAPPTSMTGICCQSASSCGSSISNRT